MRKFSLNIPTRILYYEGSASSTGFPSIGGYDPTSGVNHRWGFFLPLGYHNCELDLAYMDSQRVDKKHSWCLHASPVSPPSLVAGTNVHYVSEMSSRDLRQRLTLGRLPLAAGQEIVSSMNFTDWRTWKYAEWDHGTWTVRTAIENAAKPQYEKWHLAGKLPYFVSERVIIDDVKTDPVTGQVVEYSWWCFHGNVEPIRSSKFDIDLYKEWVKLVNRVAAWGSDERSEFSDSVSIPGVGYLQYSWRYYHKVQKVPGMYHYWMMADPEEIMECITEDPCPIGTSCRSAFQFSETSFVRTPSKLDLVHLDLDQVFRVKQLQSEAFLEATKDIPRMNDNTIQIIKDLVSILYDISQGNFSVVDSLPKTWQSLWLAGRYSIDTTVLDMREVGSFLRRTAGQSLIGSFYCKGSVNIGGVRCVCHFRAKSVLASKLQRLLYILDRHGLCPDFYIVWDSIPYSFIVDWVAPVGGAVSRTDAQVRYSSLNYEYSFISYSLTYRVDARLSKNLYSVFGPFKVECYSRWYEYHTPSSLLWSYQYAPSSTRTLTWLKRGFDVVSLLR